MNLECPIHGKPLKEGKYGLYCNQPLTRSADGKTVLEWCKYKPTQATAPQNQEVAEPLDTWGQPANTPLKKPQEEVKQPDWDKIALGKVRNSVAVAFIGKAIKAPELTPAIVELMNEWVSWIMSGELKDKEPLLSEELDIDIEKKARERAEIVKKNSVEEDLF